MARPHRRRFHVRQCAPGGHGDRGTRESQSERANDSRRLRHALLLRRILPARRGYPAAPRHSNAAVRNVHATPAVAFEIMRRTLDGAINFTASHNPPQYHGLKFSSADAGPALPEVTKDIEARA